MSTPADDRLVAPIYPFHDQMGTLLMIFSGFNAAQLTCVNGMWLTTSLQRPCGRCEAGDATRPNSPGFSQVVTYGDDHSL